MASAGAAPATPYAVDNADSFIVFVLGASGDLAKKKTYPSLYELFLADLLPPRVAVVGYARSAIADGAFRTTIRGYLKAGSEEQKDAFLALCIYRNGGYDDAPAFAKVRGGKGAPRSLDCALRLRAYTTKTLTPPPASSCCRCPQK